MTFPSDQSELESRRSSLQVWLEHSRVIPSVRTAEHIAKACAGPARLVFLLFGSPLTVGSLADQITAADKVPIANLDLLSGFARDTAAIEFLARAGIAGVISTHQDALRAARANGMLAFQRTFALDSVAIANSLRTLERFEPDVIELLPAVAAPSAIELLRAVQPRLPVIGCGLVRSLRQIDDLVRQGVVAISVSNPALWII
ncbi:MAG: glycerol-3-phosphate responsive antiterminator [Terracidiphilus sp.]